MSNRGTPSAPATPATSPTPSATSPTPTGATDVFGSCRLPVGVPYAAGEAPGGWLDLPSGGFARDPKSIGVSESNQITWDPAVRRWVPTIPANLSPDGATYVPPFGGTFKVVDARTGATLREIQVQRQPEVYPNRLVAFTSSGIYATSQGMSPPSGMWKIDPSSGTMSQVSSAPGYWAIADANYAWGTQGNTVTRMDLVTGAVKDIYKSAHEYPQIAGLAGSGALVFEPNTGRPFRASVVTADGLAMPVDVPSAIQDKRFNGFFQDGQVVLMSGQGFGLAAYDQTHGVKVLTTTPDNVQVLGRCVQA
jgi:hypothetical protein